VTDRSSKASGAGQTTVTMPSLPIAARNRGPGRPAAEAGFAGDVLGVRGLRCGDPPTPLAERDGGLHSWLRSSTSSSGVDPQQWQVLGDHRVHRHHLAGVGGLTDQLGTHLPLRALAEELGPMAVPTLRTALQEAGDRPIGQLRTSELQALVRKLTDNGLAPATVRVTFTVASQC
jgi:hypothetical protein